jgi:hypothetical protein
VKLSKALDPDPRNKVVRIFWLKARMPHVYRDTSKTLVQFADLSDSELIELTTEGTPAGDSPEGDATPG